METNEEITQKLKQSICDYYMGYIKQKLNYLLGNGKENDISNHIMDFLDAQLSTNNNSITKDAIIEILNSILLEEETNTSNLILEENRISYCFPTIANVEIKNGNAAYLTEKQENPFNGIEEKTYYLYVSPEYYTQNIENIETQIKKLEKNFKSQDFKSFEEKYKKDLNEKQYELESSKVYESVSNQITIKKQKFNNVSQKMINEYSKKYEEISLKDISDEEKQELKQKLFLETKSYDEKNHQAVSRLNLELEKLNENFQGKVQGSKVIHSQMQNLHLFDKNRFFEDMMASIIPALRDLYKERYLLNSYRKEHNEIIYTGKPNTILKFFGNVFKNIGKNNTPLMLGPHFEREHICGDSEKPNYDNIDKNLIKSLANFYTKVATSGNIVEFDNYLIDYFKTNYDELIGDNSHSFLSNFSSAINNTTSLKEGDLFKIARYYQINTEPFENNYGSNLVIKDGLIYEQNGNSLNVIYATDKAINTITQELYSSSLYYSHLAKENIYKSKENTNLQKCFVSYAKQNGIELNSGSQFATPNKRFVKRKNNIIDFKKTC